MSFYMRRQSFAANSYTQDILNGSQIQRKSGMVSIAAIATGDLDVEVYLGERQIIEKADPNTRNVPKPTGHVETSVVNDPGPFGPDIPFDLIMEDEPSAPGEYLVINVRNQDSSDVEMMYRVNVEPA